ncbi:MAG TPA: hypothetical protein VHF24_02830 [Acidimicrobiales bacterium]|nr:hypothetical protein [Acidimicrobiales bacterium]
MAEDLLRLLDLAPDWDSYGARRIDADAVRKALSILAHHDYRGTLPVAVPTTLGGVQLEWGRADDGVELEVEPDGTIGVLVDINGEVTEVETTDVDHPMIQRSLSWARQL